uniref:VPS39 subunit of HOPS complex n=1 Tax=Eptatretus burgeri TaxID=7764 RepID=A0A8C4R8C4_EPTBU
MHDAYEAVPILEKLPLQIESIACWEEMLLVGTKPGHLLLYRIKADAVSSRYEVTLEKSNRNFAKRIQQLWVVPQRKILISLCDNIVCVHDLATFQVVVTAHKTKGATLFTCDLRSHTGELRLCVVVRKKLQLFTWKNGDLIEFQPDLCLPDFPKSIAWCGDSICVGFKRDYYLAKADGRGSCKELFPTGKQLEPLVVSLTDSKLAVGRDDMTIFIDEEGTMQKHALRWTDVPISLEHQHPYIIAVLPRYLEIRTIEPMLLVQSIDLQKPRFITSGGPNIVYVASSQYVWRLLPVPIATQIEQLLQEKQFDLALQLAQMTNDSDSEKQRRIHHIQNLHAFHLFCQRFFEQSMAKFSTLGTDPSHVIGLYPDLLPLDYKKQLQYPAELPQLMGSELERGLMALIDYLTQKRNHLVKHLHDSEGGITAPIVMGVQTIRSRKKLLQIIDTTLLKCYLQTNVALIAPLLRLENNHCHLEESERVLRRAQKYSELIILYERKGLHSKALNLLKQQSQKSNSPLTGHERMVQYLQRLGKDNLKLIFEFSPWVLKDNAEEGLKIFTEDLPEVENLPRVEILGFLENNACDLTIPYLEHVIYNYMDTQPLFHNRLIELYREKVLGLLKQYLQSLEPGQKPSTVGKEPGLLGEFRSRLIRFLESSIHYQPEQLITDFPLDGLLEERAVLLGRMGNHEQALLIYVHVLHNNELAENHCRKFYDKEKEGNKDVYLLLLRTYLQPPAFKQLGVIGDMVQKSQADRKAALRLLKQSYNRLDTIRALRLLPLDVEMREIGDFLEKVLEEKWQQKHYYQLLKGLCYTQHLRAQEHKIFYENVKFVITEERVCRVCRKKIGNSAFARYPSGVVVHYSCCKDPKVCPME